MIRPPARLLPIALITLSALALHSAPGEEAALKNPWLEARFPGEGEVLVSSLRSVPRDLDNLRAVGKGEAFLPFGESEAKEEGLRLALTRNGEKIYPRWKVARTEGESVTLEDEAFGITAAFRMPPGATRLEVALTFPKGLALESAALEIMLEVGGTFLGVPTEGPADFLFTPVRGDDGKETLIHAPISMNGKDRFTPAAGWWAVGDQVARVVFACQAAFPGAALLQEPLMIDGQEALRESLVIPISGEGGRFEWTFHLLDQMTELGALTGRSGLALLKDESKGGKELTLEFGVTETVTNGRLRLLIPGEKQPLVEIEATEWKPGQLQTAKVHRHERKLEVEFSGDGFAEKAILYSP